MQQKTNAPSSPAATLAAVNYNTGALWVFDELRAWLAERDVEAATEHGIVVTNPAMHCVPDVAEMNLAILLCLARRVRDLSQRARAGEWRPDVQPVHRFARLTVGVVGYGKIGSAFAQLARALGFTVFVTSKRTPPERIRKEGMEPVGL